MPGEPGPHGDEIVTRMRRSANPGEGLGMGIRQRCRAGVGAPVLARDDRVDPCVGHAAGNDQPLLAGARVGREPANGVSEQTGQQRAGRRRASRRANRRQPARVRRHTRHTIPAGPSLELGQSSRINVDLRV